jgi:DNA repair ATPase RecN
MELERDVMRGDPEREVRAWFDKLSEVDCKRARFQDMAAEGLISFDELRAKIGNLEEIRETAEHELEVLKGRQERIAELERDKEALLETYTRMAPEKLEALTPEECRQLYKILQLKAVARVDGTVEVEMPSQAVSTIDVSSSGLTQTPGTRRTKRLSATPTTPTTGWTSFKAPGTSKLA